MESNVFNSAIDPTVSDSPPHSRIFVIFDKQNPIPLTDLRRAFEKFGNIQGIFMVRDKVTGVSKGVAYIKYSKMSEAMLALETMDGTLICNQTSTLKIHLASSRMDDNTDGHTDLEKFKRVFITAHLSKTEDEIRTYFAKFGDIINFKLLPPQNVTERRGHLVFVTYKRLYAAAKALEADDPESGYKVVTARPRDRGIHTSRNSNVSPEQLAGTSDVLPSATSQPDDSNACATVQISCPTRIADVRRLLDVAPGLIKVSFLQTTDTTTNYLATYSSLDTASYAVEKFNGINFLPGEVLHAELYNANAQNVNNAVPLHVNTEPLPSVNSSAHIPAKTNTFFTPIHMPTVPGLLSGDINTVLFPHYVVPLPPVQPMVPRCDDGSGMRLMFTCNPTALPLAVLNDLFCRFGNYSGCHIVPNKNYGFAYFAYPESAIRAVQLLNEKVILGISLSVTIASSMTESVFSTVVFPVLSPALKRMRFY